jgi:hypothetical protein
MDIDLWGQMIWIFLSRRAECLGGRVPGIMAHVRWPPVTRALRLVVLQANSDLMEYLILSEPSMAHLWLGSLA